MRLSNSRYEEIKRKVVWLFQQTKIESVPLDVWSFASSLDIKLIKISELPLKALNAASFLCDGGLKFRFVNKCNNEINYIIYDDTNPIGRQRFSILHEIGHIELDHKQDSILADAEADFFAKYAIAPPMLINLIQPSDFLDIAKAFGLSNECAYNSMNYYNKWLRVPGYSEYEYRLIEMFTTKESGGDRVLHVS